MTVCMHAETNDRTPTLPDMSSAVVELPRRNASLTREQLNHMTLVEMMSALGCLSKFQHSKDLDTTLTHCALDSIVLRVRNNERKAA